MRLKWAAVPLLTCICLLLQKYLHSIARANFLNIHSAIDHEYENITSVLNHILPFVYLKYTYCVVHYCRNRECCPKSNAVVWHLPKVMTVLF